MNETKIEKLAIGEKRKTLLDSPQNVFFNLEPFRRMTNPLSAAPSSLTSTTTPTFSTRPPTTTSLPLLPRWERPGARRTSAP